MDCTMPDTFAGKRRHSRGSGAPRGGDPRQHPLPGGGQITLRFTDQPATDTVEVAANTRNLRTNGRWRDEFALGYCANRKLIARHLVVGAERDSQPSDLRFGAVAEGPDGQRCRLCLTPQIVTGETASGEQLRTASLQRRPLAERFG